MLCSASRAAFSSMVSILAPVSLSRASRYHTKMATNLMRCQSRFGHQNSVAWRFLSLSSCTFKNQPSSVSDPISQSQSRDLNFEQKFTADESVDISLMDATTWTEQIIESGVSNLQSIGLGSYTTPSGLFQIALNAIETSGLPWWATIATGTLILRAATIPLILEVQRSTPRMLEMMNKVQESHLNLVKARHSGSQEEVSRKLKEAQEAMKKYPGAMMKTYLPMFIQGPIFLSFFFALNGMANAPLESMKSGGLFWFTDLTVVDPFYALPILTCLTFSIMLEIGADVPIRSDQILYFKNIIRVVPFLIFPIITNFPTAVLCYWTTSNFIALGQTYLLKSPEVRRKFNLPPLQEINKPSPMKKR